MVSTETVFATSEQKQDAITSIQQEIDAEQLTLPSLQAALDDAQKNYNALISVVPWGRT